ncbi:MAG: PQQ-like beta-propeller repeat protein [Bacteroidales bacterium]|nr:PQQ-like beta-propeller repeat protein [Bacteroidales bacterium]
MKRLLPLLATLLLFLTNLNAQHTFTVKIYDTDLKEMSGITVTGICQETGKNLNSTTDINGVASFTLEDVGTWIFSYLEIKDFTTYKVEANSNGWGSKTITYDPKKQFVKPAKRNRNGIDFKIVDGLSLKSKSGIATVIIEVKNKNANPLPDLNLSLVDFTSATKYTAKTGLTGQAIFYVDYGRDYELDIEGLEAANSFNVQNLPGIRTTVTTFFEPTYIDQQIVSDTIYQKNITQTNGTSTHYLFVINVKDYNNNPLANEPVFADDINSKYVYAGKTDANGKCTFLLKKGTKYLINFVYDREVYLVNAERTEGFSSGFSDRRYRGTENIRQMLVEQKQNEKGFRTEFCETPVIKAKEPQNYLTKTADGYKIDFESDGPLGTPTLAGNRLISQESFHSPNMYCLDAVTGKYLWGWELGETGMSPIVCSQNILLINTYSCTLYAFDLIAGNLLWSKWLAGTIYSTPSADDNSAYVVFDNGGCNPQDKDEDFVIASFDLQTGELNWINWLDDEVIACPVLAGNEVHVASQSGNYYVFDKSKGTEIYHLSDIKAVSSPTVTKDKIFISTQNQNGENISVLDIKTMKKLHDYKATNLNTEDIIEMDCFAKMNYNGSHPVVYKNEIVISSDSLGVYAFDANSEKFLWKQALNTNTNLVPIIAGDRVLLASTSGDIFSFDLRTGLRQNLRNTGSEIDGQPVINNGMMYVSSGETMTAFKSNLNYDWKQWNKNAGHNLWFE